MYAERNMIQIGGVNGDFLKIENISRVASILYCTKYLRLFLEVAITFNDAVSIFLRLIYFLRIILYSCILNLFVLNVIFDLLEFFKGDFNWFCFALKLIYF